MNINLSDAASKVMCKPTQCSTSSMSGHYSIQRYACRAIHRMQKTLFRSPFSNCIAASINFNLNQN